MYRHSVTGKFISRLSYIDLVIERFEAEMSDFSADQPAIRPPADRAQMPLSGSRLPADGSAPAPHLSVPPETENEKVFAYNPFVPGMLPDSLGMVCLGLDRVVSAEELAEMYPWVIVFSISPPTNEAEPIEVPATGVGKHVDDTRAIDQPGYIYSARLFEELQVTTMYPRSYALAKEREIQEAMDRHPTGTRRLLDNLMEF